jgi:hypothetical protein
MSGSRSPVMTMALSGAMSLGAGGAAPGEVCAATIPWIAVAPSAVMTQGIIRRPRMAPPPNDHESFRPSEPPGVLGPVSLCIAYSLTCQTLRIHAARDAGDGKSQQHQPAQ